MLATSRSRAENVRDLGDGKILRRGGILKRLGVVLLLTVVALAQNSTQNSGSPDAKASSSSGAQGADLASQVPSPRAEDVKSLGNILLAIYDVISGPAGDRDWKRFRSLFVPQARFTQTMKAPDGG